MINPKIIKISPPTLNWLSLINSNFFSILFIFDGNMAYKMPSMNKNRPNAMINSFIKLYSVVLGFIFPKNLKNSLSGERIKDVSPPIKAFS